jgi:D-aminoacyl-tRNA deacylase
MRAVVQRVSRAKVTVNDEIAGQIGPGLLILLGISRDDTEAEATWRRKSPACVSSKMIREK